jgi:murein DD-endopeptidase MepM/ murein hydrolase activator NlpD
MKNRKLWVSILSGILAAIMLLSLLASLIPQKASAASSDELKQELDSLKEQNQAVEDKLAELNGQLKDNLETMMDVVKQKGIIDLEVNLKYQQINNINKQITAYSLLIADKQDELTAAEKRLTELQLKNKERIQAMEEDGKLSYWSVLFKANSFADLLDRLNMIEEIAAADQRRLKEMKEAAELVEAARAELEVQKSALELTKAELEEAQKVLEQKAAEADALLADLNARGEEYEAWIHEQEEESAKIYDQIMDKQEEYDEAKYKEWYEQWLSTSVPPTTAPPPTTLPPTTAAPPPSNESGGDTSGDSGGSGSSGGYAEGESWIKPCYYICVTSVFGYRTHPTTGQVNSFHRGIDLAAGYGTTIKAAKSGRVHYVGLDDGSGTGYGNYVVIDHGDGYKTLYAHFRYAPCVSEGDFVSQGQKIGEMGSTGASTGSHLHFEIQYNNEAKNPASFINFW